MDVGFNSYVTVEEADDLVRLYFRPYDEFNVFWSVLSEEEKEGYLMRSAQQIDTLVFTGRKHGCKQAMQFPRNCGEEVPSDVKRAAVYNALGFINEDIKATAEKQMQLFKSLGVVKNLRLDQTSMAENAAPTEIEIPLASKTAYALLKPYTRGCFSIR